MFHLFTAAARNHSLTKQIIEQVQYQLIPGVDVYKFPMAIVDTSGNLLATNVQFKESGVLPANTQEPFNIIDATLNHLRPIRSGVQKALAGDAAPVTDLSIVPPQQSDNGAGLHWYEGWCLPIFQPDNMAAVLGIVMVLENVTTKRLALAEVESLRKLIMETRLRQTDILKKLNALEERNGNGALKRPNAMPSLDAIREKYKETPRREKEIFEKLAAGHTVKEVASLLGIGPKSVYTYRARLLTRLRLKSDVELAIAWRELHEV